MQMKKLFLIITLILLSGIATADCIIATAPSGTFTNAIMSLSLPTNAHGAIAVGEYANKLYCELPITTGSATKLIGLYDTTNSHAEAPSETNYGYSVTIDGVGSCYSPAGPICNAGDIEVLSLIPITPSTPLTNAHIGVFGDYSTKICCSTSAPAPITSCTVENTTTSISVGETTTYTLSCLGSSGPTACTPATWNSTSAGVATINPPSGVTTTATGVSAGTTDIEATIDTGSIDCTPKELTVTTTPTNDCTSSGGVCASSCTITNIIENHGFEDSPTSYSPWVENVIGVYLDPSQSNEGSNSLKLSSDGGTHAVPQDRTSELKPSTEYTLQVDIKAESPTICPTRKDQAGQPGHCFIDIYDYAVGYDSIGPIPIDADTDWTTVEVTEKTYKTLSHPKIRLVQDATPCGACWFDNVKVIEKNGLLEGMTEDDTGLTCPGVEICCTIPPTPTVPGDYVKITIETDKENYQQGQTPTADYITPTVTITKLQDFVTDATFEVTLEGVNIYSEAITFTGTTPETKEITVPPITAIDPETLSVSVNELVAEITNVTTSSTQPSELTLGNNIDYAYFTVQDESGNTATATPEIPFALIVFVAISAIMLISRENK